MDWKSKSGWLISMNLVFAFGALTIFYVLNAAFGQPWYPDSVLYTHTQNISITFLVLIPCTLFMGFAVGKYYLDNESKIYLIIALSVATVISIPVVFFGDNGVSLYSIGLITVQAIALTLLVIGDKAIDERTGIEYTKDSFIGTLVAMLVITFLIWTILVSISTNAFWYGGDNILAASVYYPYHELHIMNTILIGLNLVLLHHALLYVADSESFLNAEKKFNDDNKDFIFNKLLLMGLVIALTALGVILFYQYYINVNNYIFSLAGDREVYYYSLGIDKTTIMILSFTVLVGLAMLIGIGFTRLHINYEFFKRGSIARKQATNEIQKSTN